MNGNEEINHYFSLKNKIFFSILFVIVAILCVALFMVKQYYSQKELFLYQKKNEEFEAALQKKIHIEINKIKFSFKMF